MHVIQHCFICRPSDSAVSEDAGIEPRSVVTLTLTARLCHRSARSHKIKWRRGLMNNDDICSSEFFIHFILCGGGGGREEGVENTILASAVHNCIQPMLIN
jgi:hypothetical protein